MNFKLFRFLLMLLAHKHAGDSCTYWTKLILALKGVSEIWGRVLQFFYSANGLWQVF